MGTGVAAARSARAASDIDVTLATNVTEPGGTWRHISELHTGLTGLGCSVRLEIPAASNGLAQGLAGSGPSRGRRRSAAIYHLHLADTFDRRAARMIARAVTNRNIVVVTEHLPHSAASDPSLALRPPRPLAMPLKRLMKQAEFGLCSRVIAPSPSSGAFLTATYGISPAKLSVVANGVPPTPPSELPREVDTSAVPRFALAGSLIRQKGVDVLIDAAGLARQPWYVDVFGDGPHRAALELRAAALPALLGLPRVAFLGRVPGVSARLLEYAGLVMPSRWEAAPYAPLEAMAAGRPVVATRVDGLRDVLCDGGNGLLVNPDDPAALAAALDRLAADRDLQRRLGQAARLTAAEYTLDRMAGETVAVYQQALVDHRRAGRPRRHS
jgi:glycosyltransferase involved in cell wall biosynthesis